MKQTLTIGHEHFLLPDKAEFILNLSRELESIQRIRPDFEHGGYTLEPADFRCEMLSEAAFARQFNVQPNTDEMGSPGPIIGKGTLLIYDDDTQEESDHETTHSNSSLSEPE